LEEKNEYDVVILGSGMGGLACANILANEGISVIVLERNRQIGGNLQVFSRDKRFFDTGVHYIGGVDKGQILHKLFTYFGIIENLHLQKMDEDGFDRIRFGKEEKFYRYGMGYDRFRQILYEEFPEEQKAIDAYCDAILHVVKNMPLAQLMEDSLEMTSKIDFTLNAKEYIESLTEDTQLRKVLAGNNALYAASRKTPFYVHALVLHYYIESSWKAVNGFGQVAIQMAKRIRALGGVIETRAEVVGANYNEDGRVESLVLNDGREIKGNHFISNAHPDTTIRIFGSDHFPPAYVARIRSMENTGGMFVLHVALKDKKLRYKNYNIFQINNEDVWDLTYTLENWPNFFMISIPPNSTDPEYANSLSVICGMSWEEVKQWAETYNNDLAPVSRGEDYEAFKRSRAEKVITAVEEHIPGIRDMILSYSCSTPLTQRDYTLSPEGSGYGIAKDSSSPFKTMINTKTAIPNLYLTGQNITLHGILGVSLTAILTCSNIIDKASLLKKINSVYSKE
jgi:all-trans-retinol 13,14-reductase